MARVLPEIMAAQHAGDRARRKEWQMSQKRRSSGVERRSAPLDHQGAPPGSAGSRGATGAERSELALEAAGGGASDGAGSTAAETSRSPLGSVGLDATTERTTMFSMLQRHSAKVLLRAGVPQARIRQETGISERTIRRIGLEPEVDSVDNGPDRQRRRVGAPSKVEPFREVVVAALAEAPELRSVEILNRMRRRGYSGQKSAAYELIAALRSRAPRMVTRFDGVPGEFSQHDFGEVVVAFVDGRRKRIRFFATRLKYSRAVAVTIVPDQRVETLVRSLLTHFVALGGIPLMAVFDRPKTIVQKGAKDGRVLEWNKTFAAAMLELRVGVELCWPYSPEQKGAVESLVKWVKGSFFSQRRFIDEADLEAQLLEWLWSVNHERPSRATGRPPAELLEVERSRMRPVPFAPADFALLFPATVGPTAEVSFEGALYDMPPAAIGLPATLYVFPQSIRIVAGRHEAVHPRQAPGGRSRLSEHRAARLAAVSGQRGKRYLMRQDILELGSSAADYVTELVHRRELRWYADIELLHGALCDYGPEALRQAIDHGLTNGQIGGEYVRWFLESSRYPMQRASRG